MRKARQSPETDPALDEQGLALLSFILARCENLPELFANPEDATKCIQQIVDSQTKARRDFVLRSLPARLRKPGRFSTDVLDFFALLAYRGSGSQKSTLGLSEFQPVILEAVRTNDFEFFVEMGKVLSKSAAPYWNRLDYFLLKFWTDTTLEHPPLCFFTDEALFKLFKKVSGNAAVTFASLRKNRQRLELQQGKGFQVRDIRWDGTRCSFETA
jgi:hypothetical protein